MSDAHAHGGTIKIYAAIFGSLIVLTGATVGATYVDITHAGNIMLAILIAATKAILVALFFMHLKWEKRLLYFVALFPLILFCILVTALMPDCALRHMGDHALPSPASQHQSPSH